MLHSLLSLFLTCSFVHLFFVLYFLLIQIQMRVLKNDFSRYNVVEEEAHEIGAISFIITADFNLCCCHYIKDRTKVIRITHFMTSVYLLFITVLFPT